jgi:hypothetical protein
MHYQHKIKCLGCQLHFIVLSDFEDWPEQSLSGSGQINCPECGQDNPEGFIKWAPEASDKFIFQVVPGSTLPVGAE